jgi:hypothetical protein
MHHACVGCTAVIVVMCVCSGIACMGVQLAAPAGSGRLGTARD